MIEIHSLPDFDVEVVDDLPENVIEVDWVPNCGPRKHVATITLDAKAMAKLTA